MPKVRLPKAKAGVRPTSSKVKGAIFNILPAAKVEGARVLDAFAGTGALGFEALERGAAYVDFVEGDPDMCSRLRDSVAEAGLDLTAHVYCASVKKAVRFLSAPYDLILMDPPYAHPRIGDTMALIAGFGLLKKEGLLVVEHSWRTPIPDRLGEVDLIRTRRYGDTAVSFYRRESVE